MIQKVINTADMSNASFQPSEKGNGIITEKLVSGDLNQKIFEKKEESERPFLEALLRLKC